VSRRESYPVRNSHCAIWRACRFSGRLAAADADPAAGQIEKFYAALTDTMKRGKELGLEGRYRVLKPVIEDNLRSSRHDAAYRRPPLVDDLGWRQEALIDAFERMTIANYAKNFASFNGEQFVVDLMVKMRGQDKIVESKLIGSDKMVTPVQLSHAHGGR